MAIIASDYEWVIEFNGLSRAVTASFIQCNYNLYIGIIIFPHIANTQSTAYY